MIEQKMDNVSVWFFENLRNQDSLTHFVSTRENGFSKHPYDSLNLGFHVGDDPEPVLKNREQFASSIGIPLEHFTVPRQIHDGNVKVIDQSMRGCGARDQETAIPDTDAMVCTVPQVCLMVLLADCVPVLFFDPQKRVIGAAHAGWRGTIKLVARNTVKVLQRDFGCDAEDILVGIGPSIGPDRYEVGPEVIAAIQETFGTKDGYIQNETPEGKGYFNLWEANRRQLIEAGIPDRNIEVAGMCSYTRNDLFFSERRQRPTGRFGTGIMLK